MECRSACFEGRGSTSNQHTYTAQDLATQIKLKRTAMNGNEDVLYSWLNARGRKNFKPTARAQLAEKFPEYTKIGLPAHKAALAGNVEALKDIYTAFTADGVPSRDVNGATPLHLAVRGNRTEAVK